MEGDISEKLVPPALPPAPTTAPTAVVAAVNSTTPEQQASSDEAQESRDAAEAALQAALASGDPAAARAAQANLDSIRASLRGLINSTMVTTDVNGVPTAAPIAAPSVISQPTLAPMAAGAARKIEEYRGTTTRQLGAQLKMGMRSAVARETAFKAKVAVQAAVNEQLPEFMKTFYTGEVVWGSELAVLRQRARGALEKKISPAIWKKTREAVTELHQAKLDKQIRQTVDAQVDLYTETLRAQSEVEKGNAVSNELVDPTPEHTKVASNAPVPYAWAEHKFSQSVVAMLEVGE